MARLAFGASIGLTGRFFGSALQVLNQILLARYLGAAQYGLYSLGWSFLQLLAIPATLGLELGVVRFGSKLWNESVPRLRRLIRDSVFLTAGVGSVLGALVYLLAPGLADFIHKPEFEPVLKGIAVGVPILGAFRVSAAGTRVSQKIKYSAFTEEFIQRSTNLIFIVLVIVLGLGVIWSVAGLLASYLVGFLALQYFISRLYGTGDSPQSRASYNVSALVSYSSVTLLIMLVVTSLNWVDRVTLSYFRPIEEVGIYQAAAQISIVFIMVLGSVNSIFSPMIADKYHRNESDRLHELYRVSTKWSLYAILPLFGLILVVPEELLAVFGSDYRAGALTLQIIGVGQLVNVATGAIGLLLSLAGYERTWLKICALFLGLNLLLNLLLVPSFGIIGAASASAITVAGMHSSGLYFVRKELGFWPYDRRHLKGLLAFLASMLAVLPLRDIVQLPDLQLALFHALVAGVVFLGVLLALGLQPEDKEVINSLKRVAGKLLRVAR